MYIATVSNGVFVQQKTTARHGSLAVVIDTAVGATIGALLAVAINLLIANCWIAKE